MRAVIAIPVIMFAGIASAHQPTIDECPFYASAAKAIIQARNAGKTPSEVVPNILGVIQDCAAKKECPVQDGEDSKRIMDFVRAVYGIVVPPGQEIDADASAARVEQDCETRASSKHKPMTPDPNVPSTGRQIES